MIFSEKYMSEVREKKKQLQKSNVQCAFEDELREAQKSWYHFSKSKRKTWSWHNNA